jgi:hypothetical protein
MANPIKTATSTLIIELAENAVELASDNGHSGLTARELRARQVEVSLEIDRRIPIDTYVRSPAWDAVKGIEAPPTIQRPPFGPLTAMSPAPRPRAKRRR